MLAKIKKFFSEIKNYPIIIWFFAFLILYFVVDLVAPDKLFDEYQNTDLNQKPTFSLTDLRENKYTKKYENYVNDQFAFRTQWVFMKSRIEGMLLKTENNGIIYGKDGYQFSKMENIDEKKLARNIESVNNFAKRHKDKVSVMVAPSASLILQDKLPMGAPFADEETITNDIFKKLSPNAEIIDIRKAMTDKKDDYLFYRTDHHWTSDGAYLAYSEFAKAKGLTPFDTTAHKKVEVKDFYGTNYSKSLWYKTVTDTISYYDIDNKMQIFSLDADKNIIDTKDVTMYNTKAFDTRDKYAGFIYSNNALSRIQGDGKGKILVVKDSYANCFVPYLTENYAQIDVVDLRGLKGNVEFLIDENNYDDILLLYNFQSFTGVGADPEIFMLNYGVK